jgi:hypothetical protein
MTGKRAMAGTWTLTMAWAQTLTRTRTLTRTQTLTGTGTPTEPGHGHEQLQQRNKIVENVKLNKILEESIFSTDVILYLKISVLLLSRHFKNEK